MRSGIRRVLLSGKGPRRTADLDTMITRLRSAGIEVSHESEMEGISRLARIHEPKENAIELSEPAS